MQVVIAAALCLFVLVWLQRWIYKKYWDRGLEVDVRFQQRSVLENRQVKVDVQVVNRKALPLPALSVVFSLPQQLTEHRSRQRNLADTFNRNELFTLFSYQSVTRTLTFMCRQRGCYSLGELMVHNRSLFMDREDTALIPMDRQLIVCPDCVNMRNFVRKFQYLLGEILTNEFAHEDVFLIRGVREYRPYDSQRLINWKATAKLGSLMVNHYEHTDSRKVAVFLNLAKNQLGQSADIAEEAIRLAKTWCLNLDYYGIESDLYTNGSETPHGDCLKVEKKDLVQKYMNHVDEILARISCCREEEEFFRLFDSQIREHSRDCFLIFISADSRTLFQEQLIRLKGQTDKFVWVIPKSSKSVHNIRPELSSNTVFWNVYWRKEEQGEVISL